MVGMVRLSSDARPSEENPSLIILLRIAHSFYSLSKHLISFRTFKSVQSGFPGHPMVDVVVHWTLVVQGFLVSSS